MAQSVEKPTAAFVLSLIGGIFILLAGVVLGTLGAAFTFFLGGIGGVIGIFGLIWGIIVIIGSVMLYSQPEQHTVWGIIILVFSILSWFGALGGFLIGFILGLVGGILAIVFKPDLHQQPIQGDASFPPQS